ncbi:PAX3- and PAX7-binding protein 1 [Trichonephila inaurata madagascariensis]|uniref:PAX3- and PAX7-binding protein 1 n=1 Tax=Trichonephila inaurata madagascariensis TaxID=2747483 RepID=A0A8X6XLE2_9ARAC|nr:PAX3- and PAX7-binding protein 1 [Trichonephila inaurata madagascariensis]
MSLFKKPNRKFRQRESRNDSDDESAETCDNKGKITGNDSKTSLSSENTRSSNTSVAPQKEERSETVVMKTTTLLSFHDEEEEDAEVFKLKKSSYSRRLAKQREKERKKKEETVNSVQSSMKSDIDDIKIINNIEKRSENKVKEPWDVLAGNDAEDMEVESDEENEKVNSFKNVLQSGVIPDAATIYAMKKQRQMAREMGDFIPLEDPEKDDENKSRLIRDDDNDRSDDDDDEPSRINFTVNTGAVERQKIRETFLSLQDVSTNDLETEEAAELERWEREQIKKGVGVSQVAPLENSQAPEAQLYSYPQVNIDISYIGDSNQCIHSSNQQFPLELLKTKETNLTTKDIKARLEERLNALKTLHKTHEQEIQNCSKEMIEAADLVKKLAKEAPQRERNFSLYQRMSGYIKDLVECMDVKSAHIDLLEGRMVDLYKVRAQKLATRRQLDVRDQSDEFSTLSTELSKGVNIEFLCEKNICSDEIKLRRAAEREGRRMRRRKKRERLSISKSIKHQDGMSSDDEEPDIDIIQFKAARENILNEAGSIFEDVVEDFGTLDGVMNNFENWKLVQTTSYCEAYVPLCLPKIFGVFVKLALLDWNPLEEGREFEKSSWYQQLVQYGCDYPEEIKEDPDLNLLPGIMEKIILPKITTYIQKVWNPLSTSETTKLINLVRHLHETYPTIHGNSKQLQNLLQAVSTRIHKAFDDDVFIPLYPKELLENRALGASDFFQRQFWSAVKLFQNILAWEGLISEQPLQQMSLGSLLNRYLLMGLRASSMMKDTLDKCKTIVASFPKSWLKSIKGGSTMPLLKQFSLYLMKFADTYHSLALKRGMATEETKDVIKDIVQLLVTIESLDDAVSLAKKYSVSAFKNL